MKTFIDKILSRIISRALAVHNKESLCLKCGDNCRFTNNAKTFNHACDANSIVLGDGVLLDGILEVYTKGKLEIGQNTFIGNSRIFCAYKITIGAGCWIADHVFIMDSDLHPLSAKKRFESAKEFAQGKAPNVYDGIPGGPVSIGNSVWISVNSVILKGVTIGEGAVIGAGSVVTSNVPPWTIVAGNPAKVIREIPPDER
jgi:acetyltransferase-like isoleucine patch superfamily enzyme